MLILLLIISLLVVSIIIKCTEEFFGLIAIPCVWFIIIFFVSVAHSGSLTIKNEIKLYEQENNNIQTEVTSIVEKYKNYEKSTFESLKTTSPITLVTIFPELKSDALVNKQIDLYIANNTKIKELKITELQYKVSGWWLYFG